MKEENRLKDVAFPVPIQKEGDIHWNKKSENLKQMKEIPFNKI